MRVEKMMRRTVVSSDRPTVRTAYSIRRFPHRRWVTRPRSRAVTERTVSAGQLAARGPGNRHPLARAGPSARLHRVEL